MTGNNVQNVKFLRNGELFTTRELALTGMKGQLASLADGTAILGRYGSGNDVKTLVGFVYKNDQENTKSLTIFDIEGASADVAALRDEINAKLGGGISSANTATAQLEALRGTDSDTSATTSVAGAKKYADAKVAAVIETLDYTGYVVDENKVVTNITQADGIVEATGTNVTDIKIGGYVVGSGAKVAATDTVGQAFGKLQGQINAMDYTDAAVVGSYVSKVSENDGKISVERVELPSLPVVHEEGKAIVSVSEDKGQVSASAGNINAQYVDTVTAGKNFTGATVQDALEEISSKVKANAITSTSNTVTVTSSENGTDIAVNIDGTTIVKDDRTGKISSGLKIKSIKQADDSTYASQYQLVYGESNTPIGDVISVAKDQFLKDAKYDAKTQKLTLTMWKGDGKSTDIVVDFSASIIESQAGKGLYLDEGHTINVGIDAASEKVTTAEGQVDVLTVGEDNIKVQNIQAAIDYKVSTLDANKSGNSTHVTVGVEEVDGKITAVTVAESGIANATDLSALSGKAVTAVEMTGGNARLDDAADGTKKIIINADGSTILTTGGDSVNTALGKLEDKIAAAQASATTKVAKDTNATHLTLASSTSSDGSTTYTIGENDIASASALTAEIAARKAVDGQNGQTYAANAGTKYIKDATSLNDADVKLDAALKTLDEAAVKTVKVNNVELNKTSNAVNVNIQAATGATTGTGTGAITVNTDGSGNITLGIATIDAGTY